MKKIHILCAAIFMAFLFGCSCGKHKISENKYYIDINLKIVSINGETSLSSDKFHRPQTCNVILFETTRGRKLYTEYNTCSEQYPTDIHIDTKWLYDHKPGDIVHFDYLLKTRFFEIKER